MPKSHFSECLSRREGAGVVNVELVRLFQRAGWERIWEAYSKDIWEADSQHICVPSSEGICDVLVPRPIYFCVLVNRFERLIRSAFGLIRY